MSDNKDTVSNTSVTVQTTDAKSDARFLKLEILQLAAELESTAAQST